MSQGPTLVGPQVAFYDVGFSPCGMPSFDFGSLLEFSRSLFSPYITSPKSFGLHSGKTQYKRLCNKGTALAGPIKVSRMSRASAPAIHSLPKFAFRSDFFGSPVRPPRDGSSKLTTIEFTARTLRPL
jgi:hypothetical protein